MPSGQENQAAIWQPQTWSFWEVMGDGEIQPDVSHKLALRYMNWITSQHTRSNELHIPDWHRNHNEMIESLEIWHVGMLVMVEKGQEGTG